MSWFYYENNNGTRMPSSFSFFDDFKQVTDLTQRMVAGVKCPKQYQDGHLVFDGSQNVTGAICLVDPALGLIGG